MSRAYADATEWAKDVDASEPHDLRAVDEVVLRCAPVTLMRLELADERTFTGRVRGGLTAVFGILALAGPVAALTAWWDGRIWVPNGSYVRTFEANFDIDYAVPVTAIGFLLGVALQVVSVIEWWRGGRTRDRFVPGLAGAIGVCAMATLWMALRSDEAAARDSNLYLVPVVVAVFIGIGIVILFGMTAGGEPTRNVDVETMPPEAVELLLDERRSALQVLAERGLLEQGDVETWATLPLGTSGQRDGDTT